MLIKYSTEEMGKIWTEESQFKIMLKIEILAAEAMFELGIVPEYALKQIKKRAKFSVKRIKELEKKTHHDLIAFLTCIGENIGEAAKYIHMGLTSSDIKDTTLCILCVTAAKIIIKKLCNLKKIIMKKMREYKYTLMIGRTHGVHAEPISFGLKLAVWLDEINRDIERMEKAKNTIAVAKISGAVGTYAFVDPYVEQYVSEKMNLQPVKAATQIIQRDRHAEFLNSIALVGCSLDKFAIEIRNLQRTEIQEVEEFFAEEQKGSSAMPHKRNPILCERISGLARILRGNSLASLENIALWHERDISHSSVERVILPNSTVLLDYMLKLMASVIDNLVVKKEDMKVNLNKTGGLIFSQRLLLSLIDKGVTREEAYLWVQRNAMAAWIKKTNFKENIIKDSNINKFLTKKEINNCFNYQYYLRHIDTIFKRFAL